MKNSKKIKSPGQLKLHYSPGIPVKLNRKNAKKNQAFIGFGKNFKVGKNHFNLSKKGSLKEAANNLYKTMRKIKKRKFKSIAVVKIPNTEIGCAINDRLIKASKQMNAAIIEVNNLTKKFKNVLAVDDISFTINKGKILGLLGPNGCGKSTTIGMMLGLIKPTSGIVNINKKNIENNRTSLLGKMNFISPYIELPKKLTVEENLKVYGRLYGVKSLKEKIYNLLEKLNLTEFRSRKTGELSSGQKNRVSLAKALINDPEILLLDEPTASLDPDVGDTIRSFIENFASKKGTTILLASHNMNEVERLCHEVMMMKDGKIIDKGKSNDLISRHGRKNLEEVFLKIARE